MNNKYTLYCDGQEIGTTDLESIDNFDMSDDVEVIEPIELKFSVYFDIRPAREIKIINP